ncbi:MAG TPA: TetR/AcrR family transcriptional regulator [Roseiflexaceae bacterium]
MSAHPESHPSERGPGRPREPEVDQRILDAALRLMAQGGYVRMSMDAIAAEAGVTKPTIYRRYLGKVQLAMAAVVAYCDQAPPVYTGETRGDLIVQMSHFRRALDRPNGMAMLGTVLAEEHETPELLANFREYLVSPRRRAVRAILDRARARGELRDAADLDLAGNMLIGAYYAQYLAGEPFADDWAERTVDAVLASIARPA